MLLLCKLYILNYNISMVKTSKPECK